MLTYLGGFVTAFVVAFVITPIVRWIAIRLGALDKTTRDKIHAIDIPRLGGVAIVGAFYFAVLSLLTRTNEIQDRIYEDTVRITHFLVGGVFILGLGVYDDLKSANATKKLIVQTAVAVFMWYGGYQILGSRVFVGHELLWSKYTSLIVTVLWIVGIINAFNLVDGLDGLASGVAFLALATTALCAWHRKEMVLTFMALCMVGAVSGFLFHNFHPAKIFMGDSGSMFLGYVVATTAIWSYQKSTTVISTLLPMLVVGLPILEVSLTVFRRLLSRKPVFDRDLDHIHYRLIRQGWSHTKSVMVLYGIQLVFCAIALVVVFSGNTNLRWPSIALAVAIALVFIRWIGYRFSR